MPFLEIFSGALNEYLDSTSQQLSSIDLEKDSGAKELLDHFFKSKSQILQTIKESAPSILQKKREYESDFTIRNIDRWKQGFDLLEIFIQTCVEAGNEFNTRFRSSAVKNNDLVFEAVVGLHAKSCLIANEILCLLKNGYPDGAYSKWRSLHEQAVTAYFIKEHGQEVAERYFAFEIIEAYKGIEPYNKHAEILGIEPFSDDEVEQIRIEREALITKYGDSFKEDYGWARHLRKSNFAMIEESVGLAHFRPYYRQASQYIHANTKGLKNRLGLSKSKEEVLLVGQSNNGMTEAAHSCAISLHQITTALLSLNTGDDLEFNIMMQVLANVLASLTENIGRVFYDIDNLYIIR